MCAKVRSHVARLKTICTHAHGTHFSEWISHAHVQPLIALARFFPPTQLLGPALILDLHSFFPTSMVIRTYAVIRFQDFFLPTLLLGPTLLFILEFFPTNTVIRHPTVVFSNRYLSQCSFVNPLQ